jgi:hypothetical protein
MMNTVATRANKVLVNLYKFVGLITLAAILVGLASFFVVNLFYLVNDTWMAPVILSPSHDRVVNLRSQLAQQAYQREKLDGERLELEAQLRQADRAILERERFLEMLDMVVEREREQTNDQVAALRKMHKTMGGAQRRLSRSGSEYGAFEAHLLEQHKKGRLIDKEAYTRGQYLLSQVQLTGATAKERALDLEWRARELELRSASLDAFLGKGGVVATRDGLELVRQAEEARLQLAALRENHVSLTAQLGLIDKSAARYDALLADIQQSPYLRAVEGRVTIAFVPYDNLDNVDKGDTIYGCHLHLVACTQVGTVESVLDGEVAAKHPLDNRDVRGLMVEIRVQDPDWARDATLFSGRRPLWVL